MSNEEKILSMLTKLQGEFDTMKVELETLKQKENPQSAKKEQLSAKDRFAMFEAMRNLLTDEEKDELGRYQAAEEARKAALYG